MKRFLLTLLLVVCVVVGGLFLYDFDIDAMMADFGGGQTVVVVDDSGSGERDELDEFLATEKDGTKPSATTGGSTLSGANTVSGSILSGSLASGANVSGSTTSGFTDPFASSTGKILPTTGSGIERTGEVVSNIGSTTSGGSIGSGGSGSTGTEVEQLFANIFGSGAATNQSQGTLSGSNPPKRPDSSGSISSVDELLGLQPQNPQASSGNGIPPQSSGTPQPKPSSTLQGPFAPVSGEVITITLGGSGSSVSIASGSLSQELLEYYRQWKSMQK